MPCCIQKCPGGSQLVRFPQDTRYQTRWLEAIQVGTGTKLDTPANLACSGRPQHELCLSHFAQPDKSWYQDPTQFIARTGKPVRLACCRLCHRFERETAMFSLAGTLAGVGMTGLINQTVKVRLKAEDFLRFICRECLVKVDLIRALQNKFLLKQVHFHDLEKKMPPLDLVQPHADADEVIEVLEEVVVCEDELEQTESEEVKIIWEPLESEMVLLEVEMMPPSPKVETTVAQEKDLGDEDVPLSSLRTKSSLGKKRSDVEKAKPKKRHVVKEKTKRGRPKVEKPPSKKKVEDRQRTISSRTCYICNTQFPDKDELLVHLTRVHAGQIEYSCKDCGDKKFPLLSSYNLHLSLHDPKRPYKCSFCSIRYCFPYSIKEHENKYHGADHKLHTPVKRVKPKAQCETCGKFFNSLKLVREHNLLEHEKGIVAQCKICDKTFVSHPNLRRHMLMHTDERPYVCRLCGVRYKVSTDLNKHILAEHQGEKPYKCVPCSASFQTINDYYKHRNKLHLKRSKNAHIQKCLLCSQELGNLTELEAHVESSHQEEEYPYTKCSGCPAKFLTTLQLYRHKYYKHGEAAQAKPRNINYVVCDLCGKKLSSKSRLIVHMALQHGAEKQWACEICGKQFAIKGNMQRHVDTHKEEKKFRCDFCDKTFSQKGAMLNHRRNIHTGERPFECGSCGEKFKESSTFYRHRAACQGQGDEAGDGSS